MGSEALRTPSQQAAKQPPNSMLTRLRLSQAAAATGAFKPRSPKILDLGFRFYMCFVSLPEQSPAIEAGHSKPENETQPILGK